MPTLLRKPPALTCRSDQMGFFTWELATNILHGDEVLAGLFDIQHVNLKDGIPIERILARIDADDRPRIAKAIHTAIITGDPYEETYNVIHDSGSSVQVLAMGRCFQYADGTPSHYAGTVVEVAKEPLPAEERLRAHCVSALSLARTARKPLAERYLASALRILGEG